MPLSEKLLKIMEFARKRAEDPEFLAKTVHRRPAETKDGQASANRHVFALSQW